ncbi:hypothetical protein C0585_07285 [Candidatus Woesearchaeota archaeon]|nr:MAG: hypothetical protein C0585_07285 [Candidatus Woesearchaeota archaeon]
MNFCAQLQDELKSCSNSVEELQYIFFKYAKKILVDSVLLIGSLEIELTEIEFYYFDCKTHSDPYVHTDSLQKKTKNYLYVHKQCWNRGGIDITFGNGIYFGGILIRGIKYNGKFIAGPATVKKYLNSKLNPNFKNHTDLQKYFENIKDDILLNKFSNKKYKVFSSVRVGLKEEKSKKYANALYRFAREDYLNEGKNINFESYSNIKCRSMLKAISELANGIPEEDATQKTTIKKIKNNDTLIKYIIDFKNRTT